MVFPPSPIVEPLSGPAPRRGTRATKHTTRGSPRLFCFLSAETLLKRETVPFFYLRMTPTKSLDVPLTPSPPPRFTCTVSHDPPHHHQEYLRSLQRVMIRFHLEAFTGEYAGDVAIELYRECDCTLLALICTTCSGGHKDGVKCGDFDGRDPGQKRCARVHPDYHGVLKSDDVGVFIGASQKVWYSAFADWGESGGWRLEDTVNTRTAVCPDFVASLLEKGGGGDTTPRSEVKREHAGRGLRTVVDINAMLACLPSPTQA